MEVYLGDVWVGIISSVLLLADVLCFYCLRDCSLRWLLGGAGPVLPSPCNTSMRIDCSTLQCISHCGMHQDGYERAHRFLHVKLFGLWRG